MSDNRSPVKEWKNRDALDLRISDCAPQTVQNQINPAQNTGKREKQQGDWVLLLTVLPLVI